MTGLLAIPSINVDSGAYGIAVRSAMRFLSTERSIACQTELGLLEQKENYMTVEYLREDGKLSKETEIQCMTLAQHEITADRLTPEETAKVHDFVTNATDDIIESKVRTIMDVATRVLNGKSERRDYGLDIDKAERLENIINKGVAYERGEIDLSRGFDYTAYPKNGSISEQEFENYLLSMDTDELLEREYIEEGDFFVYGPYTVNDMDYLSSFAQDTWVRATDHRLAGRLQNFFDDVIGRRNYSLDDDLNRNFVGREIVPARRLTAKNMVTLVCGFARECEDLIFSNKVKYADDPNFDELKKIMHLFSYYLSMICGFRRQEMLDKWNAPRPLNGTFYKEAADRAEAWDTATEAQIESDFGAYFIKLDDHLFEGQALYANIMIPKRPQEREMALLS